MNNQGFLINLIDGLTQMVLLITAIFLVFKKCWINRPMTCILINVCYSMCMFLVGLVYPMESKENEIISNLTMHIDTLSGFGFLYFLWINQRYRKFLVNSIIPVFAIWLLTFIIKRDLAIHYWNLILSSVWFLIAAQYSMLLLYRKASFTETVPYTSRFLLIAGFLFYNFIYLVAAICYRTFTSIANITDAWNINYWAYFIFRIMMLAGVLAWYSKRAANQPVLAKISK